MAGALFLVGTAVTIVTDRWIIGPGTTAPVNGYRFPLFDFNRRVDFGDNGNLFAFVEGWDNPEARAVWSLQNKATIAFRLPDGQPMSDASELRLHLNAYLAPPGPMVQHLSVWMGATELAAAVITTSDAEVTIPLKGVSLPRDPTPIILTFKMPDAVSRHDLEGRGSRQRLSIGLLSLEITR